MSNSWTLSWRSLRSLICCSKLKSAPWNEMRRLSKMIVRSSWTSCICCWIFSNPTSWTVFPLIRMAWSGLPGFAYLSNNACSSDTDASAFLLGRIKEAGVRCGLIPRVYKFKSIWKFTVLIVEENTIHTELITEGKVSQNSWASIYHRKNGISYSGNIYDHSEIHHASQQSHRPIRPQAKGHLCPGPYQNTWRYSVCLHTKAFGQRAIPSSITWMLSHPIFGSFFSRWQDCWSNN